MNPVANPTGGFRRHSYQGGDGQIQLRGCVHPEQFGKLFFYAAVVCSQRQQDLAELRPTFLGFAGREPPFRIGVGGNENRADDVPELFARSGAHGPAHRLHHVNGTLARFQERHRRKGWRVGTFTEYPHVDDPMGFARRSLGQTTFGMVTPGDVVGRIQMFQSKRGRCTIPHLFAQPHVNRLGLKVGGHVL